MPNISIDINTRVLPADHRVFIVRPGAGYRLYDQVRDRRAILFDLPGLELGGNKFSETEGLTAKVLRSQALRYWYKVGRGNGQQPPPRDLADYPYPDNASDRRSLGQMLAIGRAYFETARVGDMVLVPPLSFGAPVLIGEITGKAYFETTLPEYGNEVVYGRRVKWIAEVTKNDVPPRFIEISQKPNSFVQLEKTVAKRFYDLAYKNYFFDDKYQAEFRVNSDHFGSTDDAKITAFLNFVAANFGATQDGSDVSSIFKAAFADLGKYEPDQRININSPGARVLYSTYILPIVASVLLSVCAACSPADLTMAVEQNTIMMGNSSGTEDDQCAAEVYKATLDWLILVGADEWLTACELAKQAIDSAQVETPTKVELN